MRADAATVHQRRWWTLAVLCLTLVITGIDATVLNVAIPTLVRELHASSAQLEWIVDAYTLVFAGLLLTAGSLGDRLGRAGALRVGLVIFGTASAAAAWASNPTQLALLRAVIGVGAAFVMPATLSILTNVFRDPIEQRKAIGIWAAVTGIALVIGPVGGGLLLSHFWWGSVFFVNVPVVIVALVAGHWLVPTSRDPSAPPADPLGAVLSMSGLAAVLWAIIDAPVRGWTEPAVLGVFLAGLCFLSAFVFWELHSPHPMLDMRVFRNPSFSVASATITLIFFSGSSTLFVLTQFLQSVRGYSPLAAGVRVAPMSIGIIGAGVLSGRVVDRVGTKRVVAIGMAINAAALVVIAANGVGTPYGVLFVGLVLFGIGNRLAMPAATMSIMASLPAAKAGVGSAVNDTTRQSGIALGVAVIGSLLASSYRSRLSPGFGLGAHALHTARTSVAAAHEVAAKLGKGAGAGLVRAADDAFVGGMRTAFVVSVSMLVLGVVLALIGLPAHAESYAGSGELVPELADGQPVTGVAIVPNEARP